MKTQASPLLPLSRRLSAILFIGTLAAAPIFAGGFSLPAQTGFAALLLIAVLLRLGGRHLAKSPDRLATPADIPIAVLLLAAFLSLPFSVNRHDSVAEFIRLLSCAASFYLAAALAQPASVATATDAPLPASGGKPGRAKREPKPVAVKPARQLSFPLLWGAVLAGASWAAAVGVQEYLRALRSGQTTYRSFGGFSHPNTLAGHLALLLPLFAAAVLALRGRKDSYRAAWPLPALLFLIALAALFLTASRLGILAAGLGIVIFCVRALAARRGLTWKQIVALAAGLCLVGALAVLAMPTLRLRILAAFSGAESFSLGFRVTTWAAAWRIFLAHPLAGVGIGAFSSVMTHYSATGYTQTAHNHYLQTAAETGFLGLAALPALLLCWFRAVCGKKETQLTPSRSLFLAAVIAGVAASAAHSLVDFDWSIPATGWTLWALLGAGMSLSGATRRVPTRPAAEAALALLLLLALAPAALLEMGGMRAARAMELKESDPLAAVTEYQEALQYDPLAPETHRELGRLLGGIGLQTGDRERSDEGEAHLRRAIQLAPTVSINYYHLGLLLMRQGRTADAASAFRQTLYWDPHSTYALRQLGSLYEHTRPAETLQAARKLAALENSVFERLRPLAEVVDQNYAFAHYWLGQERERRSDKQGAAAEYARARKIIEDYKKSLQGVGGLLSGQDPDVDILENALAGK